MHGTAVHSRLNVAWDLILCLAFSICLQTPILGITNILKCWYYQLTVSCFFSSADKYSSGFIAKAIHYYDDHNDDDDSNK